MASDSGIVIVGASLAGLTAAETLRAEGYAGPLTLVGEEFRLPYHRPPLSKQVLTGAWEPGQAELASRATLESLGIRLRLGERATGLDPAAHTVAVGGEPLPYERLIVATGVIARRVPGARSLRTMTDALALRTALAAARRVAVIGAGVLGCEIAAAVRKSDLEVTLIGRGPEITLGRLGGMLSARIAGLLRGGGIEVLLGREVRHVDDNGVGLTDGTVIGADLVVAAIGCIPAVDWLRGSGLDLADGVRCDERGMAAPDVYAIGDVASWRDPVTGAHERVEHQAVAVDQAQAVARLIATGERPERVVPFFWSELFGTRIQVSGRPDGELPVEVIAGDPTSDRFVLASTRDDAITGLVGWNMPREFRIARARLATESTDVTKGRVPQ